MILLEDLKFVRGPLVLDVDDGTAGVLLSSLADRLKKKKRSRRIYKTLFRIISEACTSFHLFCEKSQATLRARLNLI